MSPRSSPSPPDTDIVQATQAWQDSVPHSETKLDGDVTQLTNDHHHESAMAAMAPHSAPLEKEYSQPPATMLLHPSIATDESSPKSSPKLNAVETGKQQESNRPASRDGADVWAKSPTDAGRQLRNEDTFNLGEAGHGSAKVADAQHARSESPPAVFSSGSARVGHQVKWESQDASVPPTSSYPPPPPGPVHSRSRYFPPRPPSSIASSMRFFAPLAHTLKRSGMNEKPDSHRMSTNPRVEDDPYQDVVTVKQAKEAEKRAQVDGDRTFTSHQATPQGMKDGARIDDQPSAAEHNSGRRAGRQGNDGAAIVEIPPGGDIPTFTLTRSTPMAGHRMPASTQYPSTLQPSEWTDMGSADDRMTTGTIMSSTAADPNLRDKHHNMDPISVIREGLGWLPTRYLEEMDKDDLRKLVLLAIESMSASQEAASGLSGDQRVRGVAPCESDDTNRQTSDDASYYASYDSDGTVVLERDFAQLDTNQTHERETVVGGEAQVAESTTEYFEKMTRSRLPAGWMAEYDHQQHAWYFINNNTSPPSTTWYDPRDPAAQQAAELASGAAMDHTDPWASGQGIMPWPGAKPYPEYMSDPATARAYADWYAKTFAGFQAHRMHNERMKGPVAASLDSEKKRLRKLSRAQALIQEASRRLAEATAGKPTEEKMREKDAAEVDLARAQGMIDRLQHDDEQRKAAVPSWMADYEGVTRGFEAPSERHRAHYVDAEPSRPRPSVAASYAPHMAAPMAGGMPLRPMPGPVAGGMPMPQWPMNGGAAYHGGLQGGGNAMRMGGGSQMLPMPVGPAPGMAKQAIGGSRLPRSMNVPTVYPAPPGMLGKGSATPTPYGLPEACFAWDMILRSSMATDKLARRPNYRGHDGAGNLIT